MQQIIDNVEALNLPEAAKKSVLDILKCPDIRFVRRLKEPVIHPPTEGLKRVIFLDTETTGVNTEDDELIELGYVIVEFTNTGQLGNVIKIFNQLNEPVLPILNSSIHGISNEDVKGCKIDFSEVENDINSSNLVVAHNSNFDRRVVERYTPGFKTIPWACTFKDIDWKSKGLNSNKLDFLAYTSGFFYEAHRAVVDVYAMLEIVRRNNLFLDLLRAALKTQYLLAAQGSPFGRKDLLKERGYKPLYAGGKFKCWYTTVEESVVETEKAWLLKEGGCMSVPTKTLTALERYSCREDFK